MRKQDLAARGSLEAADGSREKGTGKVSMMFALSARDEENLRRWNWRATRFAQIAIRRAHPSRRVAFLRRNTLSTDAIRSRALPLPEKASHRQLTPPAGRDKLHAGTTRARAFSVNFPYHEARDRVRPSNAGYISKTRFSQRERESERGRGRGRSEKVAEEIRNALESIDTYPSSIFNADALSSIIWLVCQYCCYDNKSDCIAINKMFICAVKVCMYRSTTSRGLNGTLSKS